MGDTDSEKTTQLTPSLTLLPENASLFQIIMNPEVSETVAVCIINFSLTFEPVCSICRKIVNSKWQVGCILPRHVAVMKRVGEEMETKLWGKVGYAIRFKDMTGPNTITRICGFFFL